MDLADIAKLLGADLAALAAIAGIWAFIAKDGASVRTRMGVLGVVGVVIFVAGWLIWARPDPTGQIVSPASGASVSRDIKVRGVLADVADDQHVWVVVRDGNRLYPQGSEVSPPDGEWSFGFHQAGPAKSISLELYVMGNDAHEAADDAAGNSSGVTRLSGAERLDVVENVRIRG